LIHEHGGGVLDGRPVAIMPAARPPAFIVADDKVLDTPMDYASVRTLGADLLRHR
jgi:NADH:ubiquinone oxidoreductase subunit F (NADH-binding)